MNELVANLNIYIVKLDGESDLDTLSRLIYILSTLNSFNGISVGKIQSLKTV